MDLTVLHSLMSKKKYYYFEGSTNSSHNNLYLSFSTGYNGRGDAIDIRIGVEDNDVKSWSGNIITESSNINDNELLLFIENINNKK